MKLPKTRLMAYSLRLKVVHRCYTLQAIPDKCTGALDNRIYIITDVLLASAVSTKQGSSGSLVAGVNPLAAAALAHGVPLPAHTPEISLEVSQASDEGEHCSRVAKTSLKPLPISAWKLQPHAR